MHRTALTLTLATRRTLLASLLPLLALVAAPVQAQAYRWVDKNGTVHYSDQPVPGAERVDLPSAQSYKAPPAPPVRVTTTPAAGAAGSASAKMTCAITSPAQDETFPNDRSVTISYRGPEGYFANLYLNGARVDAQSAGTSLIVSPIDRGTYQAAVAFSNTGSGAEVCRTPTVTFHVRQPSLLSPARPQQPRPTPLPSRPAPAPR
jgi:hypothetical protein